MALLVFGAGATRGASFVKESPSVCLPPLDADFFTQLQRVSAPKNQEIVERVVENLVEVFGKNFRLTLEEVYTTIEQTALIYELRRRFMDPKAWRIWDMRRDLFDAIGAVLEESLTDQSEGHKREPRACTYHNQIVSSLEATDQIISFNYDCLLDQTLKMFGNGIWNSRYGYGLKLGAKGSLLRGDLRWQPDVQAKRGAHVMYYKLHGSLNFRYRKGVMTLKERPYTRQQRRMDFLIVPPEWHKSLAGDSKEAEHPLLPLWRQAAKGIRGAKTLVFVGYSMPKNDLHASSLFRASMREGKLKSLVVVNPDHEARRRTREIVVRGISPSTRVFSFDSLEQFARAPRRLWDYR